MKKKLSMFMIGILLISSFFLCSIPITATKEKELVSNDMSYEFGLIVIDGNSILGLPEYEHVGGLNDLEISTNGFIQAIIFTIPVWGSAIIQGSDNLHISMDHFLLHGK
jgi:hypothetical protein